MGYYKYEDLSKQKFGKLQPVEYIPSIRLPNGRRSHAKWRCICDCGNTTESRPELLKNGGAKSCGCKRTERLEKVCYFGRLPLGEAQSRGVFFHYIRMSIKRKQKFSLSYEEAMDIFESNCHYCGAEPSNRKRLWHNNHDFIYSGIDRIDCTNGYVPGNCVPCCRRCNVAKNDMGYQEFLCLVTRIYTNRVASNIAAD